MLGLLLLAELKVLGTSRLQNFWVWQTRMHWLCARAKEKNRPISAAVWLVWDYPSHAALDTERTRGGGVVCAARQGIALAAVFWCFGLAGTRGNPPPPGGGGWLRILATHGHAHPIPVCAVHRHRWPHGPLPKDLRHQAAPLRCGLHRRGQGQRRQTRAPQPYREGLRPLFAPTLS